ncbi:MAG TPA: lysophospholipid acyltransferase family protein [Verrucomicrobiae bacterium]
MSDPAVQIAKRPARKSGVVVPQRPKWHGQMAAFALWSLGSSLSKTWRIRFTDQSGLLEPSATGPIIFALWHNRLATAMTFWSIVRKRRGEAGLAALISASRDGGLLSRTFEHFGVTPIRGSSSRRGAQALIELVSVLRDGYHVAITPDGPRGPKYSIQPGIISLAQLSGAPIVPAGAIISAKKKLKSWDNFQIPLPFARCELQFGPPIRVPRRASEEELNAIRGRLAAEMRRLNPD